MGNKKLGRRSNPAIVLPRRRVIEAGLLIVAVGVPLAWSVGLYAEYDLPKLFVLTAGLLVASGGLVLAVSRGEKPFRWTGLEPPIVVVLGALALSAVRSVDPITSVIGNYNDHTHGLWPLLLLAALCCQAAWVVSGDARRRVLVASVAAAALAGGYAVLQALGLEISPNVGPLPGGRAVSFMGNAVFLGAYLAVASPVALHLAVAAKGGGRVLAVLGFLGVCAGIVASTSRGALLAAFCACGAYLLMTRGPRIPKLSRGQWVAAAAAGLIAVLAVGVRYMSRDTTQANRSRAALYGIGWRAFRDRPLLGSGPDTFEWGFRRHRSEAYIRSRRPGEFKTHAHNDLLQALSTAGVLGLGAYLFAVVWLALFGWRRVRREGGRDGPDGALLAALVALFIVMKFNPPHLAAMALAALYLGLLFGGEEKARGSLGGRAACAAAACAFLLFSAGSVWFSFRLVSADRHFKRAVTYGKIGRHKRALAHYRNATGINRCELKYRMGMVNHILSRVYGAPAGRTRSTLIEEAAACAREAKACRPQSMLAHYISGMVDLARVGTGQTQRLESAQAALDRGLELDPLNASLLRARGRAALMAGDAESAERFNGLARHLETLRP
ncbi:O-antigen ligase family protein [Elusimicrobiota bacterium]